MKGVLALKEGKERKCVVIFVLREVTLLEIALILPVGNVERKDMKKRHALSNKLKIKDKWIWWDGYHWYYITKIEEISDEQLISEIAFVY